jgi:hypothetical protein
VQVRLQIRGCGFRVEHDGTEKTFDVLAAAIAARGDRRHLPPFALDSDIDFFQQPSDPAQDTLSHDSSLRVGTRTLSDRAAPGIA